VEEIVVEGRRIEITHPDKIIWEDQSIKKMDYIQYLLDVSPYLIEHAKERLLMVWIFPHGINGKKIEKRSVPKTAPEWVSSIFYKEKERMLLNDRATLVWAANYGTTVRLNFTFHLIAMLNRIIHWKWYSIWILPIIIALIWC
jgi:bifunctional non-homologous end joining protein LigD